MMKQIRWIVVACCAAIAITACTDGLAEYYVNLYPECTITVFNESDFIILEIYIVESASSEWENNLLTAALPPDNAVAFSRTKGVYNLRIVQEGDVFTDVPDVDVTNLEEYFLTID